MVKPYEPLYTVKGAAQVLLTNTDAVYALIKSGELKSLKLGSRKIKGTDLEAFIESRQTGENQEKEKQTNHNL